ncbi:hypothetical protein BDN71DRAFT_1507387 [Pleurotus eryngii]|uniref:Uncharacterized protein n=1 Tax=Pleurotus eryngii TaxID=5323 RepID=A0A9P6DF09_PLEER|nr:hypothetical protein BDN71DRAFT_1507387 [Pleurotus eryngii]
MTGSEEWHFKAKGPQANLVDSMLKSLSSRWKRGLDSDCVIAFGGWKFETQRSRALRHQRSPFHDLNIMNLGKALGIPGLHTYLKPPNRRVQSRCSRARTGWASPARLEVYTEAGDCKERCVTSHELAGLREDVKKREATLSTHRIFHPSLPGIWYLQGL